MDISTRAKAVLSAVGVVTILLFLIIVDLGISAGRIHKGVDVKGVDVGGLTPTEAGRKLTTIGEELATGPLVFTSSDVAGFECRTTPAALGWNPRPFPTARNALAVGRDDAPFGALVDRFRAWTTGVTTEWDDSPDEPKVDRFLDACRGSAVARGADIDEGSLRETIEDVIGRWPYEQSHVIVLER